MEQLSAAVANARAGMTVVADDENGSYLLPEITAVASISVDTGAGTFRNVIVGAFASNDIAVTNAQSGSVVTIPVTGAASTITLPTSPVDGFNARFVAEADNAAHTITVAGAFEGIVLDNTHATTLDNTTNVVIAASKFKIGDFFEVVYSGTAGGYKISGAFITDDAIAAN